MNTLAEFGPFLLWALALAGTVGTYGIDEFNRCSDESEKQMMLNKYGYAKAGATLAWTFVFGILYENWLVGYWGFDPIYPVKTRQPIPKEVAFWAETTAMCTLGHNSVCIICQSYLLWKRSLQLTCGELISLVTALLSSAYVLHRCLAHIYPYLF